MCDSIISVLVSFLAKSEYRRLFVSSVDDRFHLLLSFVSIDVHSLLRQHANKSHIFLFNDVLIRAKRRVGFLDSNPRYEFKDRHARKHFGFIICLTIVRFFFFFFFFFAINTQHADQQRRRADTYVVVVDDIVVDVVAVVVGCDDTVVVVGAVVGRINAHAVAVRRGDEQTTLAVVTMPVCIPLVVVCLGRT
jgi:hypothetical protein